MCCTVCIVVTTSFRVGHVVTTLQTAKNSIKNATNPLGMSAHSITVPLNDMTVC